MSLRAVLTGFVVCAGVVLPVNDTVSKSNVAITRVFKYRQVGIHALDFMPNL